MTIKLGIIGLGWAFWDFHYPGWAGLRDVKVTAVCDLNPHNLDRAAHMFDAQAFNDGRDLIENAKIDALYLLLPPDAHGSLEELAIECGIPFFIEKPITLDLSLAERIEKLVAAKSLITSVGFHRRYTLQTDHIRQMLDGRRSALVHTTWLTTVPTAAWWKNINQSGGQIIEQGSHILDLYRYLFGEINSLVGKKAKRLTAEHPTLATDTHVLLCEFHNGMLGTLSMTCGMPDGHHRVQLQIVADEISLELFEDDVYLHKAQQTEIIRFSSNTANNPYTREGNIFFDAVRTGDMCHIRSPYSDAVKTLRLALSARQALQDTVNLT